MTYLLAFSLFLAPTTADWRWANVEVERLRAQLGTS
jgi:hypothetical protein